MSDQVTNGGPLQVFLGLGYWDVVYKSLLPGAVWDLVVCSRLSRHQTASGSASRGSLSLCYPGRYLWKELPNYEGAPISCRGDTVGGLTVLTGQRPCWLGDSPSCSSEKHLFQLVLGWHPIVKDSLYVEVISVLEVAFEWPLPNSRVSAPPPPAFRGAFLSFSFWPSLATGI